MASESGPSPPGDDGPMTTCRAETESDDSRLVELSEYHQAIASTAERRRTVDRPSTYLPDEYRQAVAIDGYSRRTFDLFHSSRLCLDDRDDGKRLSPPASPTTIATTSSRCTEAPDGGVVVHGRASGRESVSSGLLRQSIEEREHSNDFGGEEDPALRKLESCSALEGRARARIRGIAELEQIPPAMRGLVDLARFQADQVNPPVPSIKDDKLAEEDMDHLLAPGYSRNGGVSGEMLWKICYAARDRLHPKEQDRIKFFGQLKVGDRVPAGDGVPCPEVHMTDSLQLRDEEMGLALEMGLLLLTWKEHCALGIALPDLEYLLLYDAAREARSFPKATMDFARRIVPNGKWQIKVMHLPKQSPNSWDCLICCAVVAVSCILGLQLPDDLSHEMTPVYRKYFAELVRGYKHKTGKKRKAWEAEIKKLFQIKNQDKVAIGVRVLQQALRAASPSVQV